MSRLRSYLLISRCEFMPGGIFFLFLVAALASGSWRILGAHAHLVLWGSAVWYLSHLIGSQVNCLADRDLDRDNKPKYANAVDQLGSRAIWSFIFAESLLALLVVVHMVRLTGRFALGLLWGIGWLASLAYSLEPLRLKRRVLWNPLCLLLILYSLPVAFGYVALTDQWKTPAIIILTAIGLQMLSLMLMNEVPDIPEDAAHGIETPCVHYGLCRVARVALLLFTVGAAVALAGFATLAGPDPARLTVLALVGIIQIVVIRDLSALIRHGCRSTADDIRPSAIDAETRRLGRRNPAHFAILGLSIGAASILSLH